ncbi:MAG: hypothetical protein AAGF27_08195 [Pseudomonadota bacterium]
MLEIVFNFLHKPLLGFCVVALSAHSLAAKSVGEASRFSVMPNLKMNVTPAEMRAAFEFLELRKEFETKVKMNAIATFGLESDVDVSTANAVA